MDELLDLLAQRRGIGQEYTDIWGKTTQTSMENKRAILDAMGYATTEPEVLSEQISHEDLTYWQQMLDPVYVLRQQTDFHITCRLPATVESLLNWRIELEEGAQLSGVISLNDSQKINSFQTNELLFSEYVINIQQNIPNGYHQFNLLSGNNTQVLATSSLIVAPANCFHPEFLQRQQKCWGPSVQLYTLRSQRNWGVGDFTDLNMLLRGVAAWGADFVGLNPIHALYPANPESCSPYSPSSRRWLNVIYIDVEAIPDFVSNPALQKELAAPEIQEQLNQLRAVDWIDYQAVFSFKIGWLRRVFEGADLSARTERGKAFAEYIAAGGDGLLQMATFDALQNTLYAGGLEAWGPPVWPEVYRSFDSPAVQTWIASHQLDIRFYQYLQWIADQQLAEAEQLAKALGMKIGLYRDLAVGVSEGSCEIWANKDLYCPKASIGAPPDPLGPQGQNWGLPPIDPVQLKRAAYRPFIELLRANMRGCGALRIDHVMGLRRLWWVPPGAPSSMGAYVYYPVEEMLAILALESHRERCMVIGEDLGTVPPEMRTLLHANGVYSYKVFFFERAADGGYFSPAHYPAQAMAALTTHDMPTLRGFWHCDDLALGRDLGLYPDEEKLQDLYRERHSAKQAILDSLAGHGVLPDSIGHDVSWVGMNTALAHALQEHMCRGNSALFSTQLEDWLEMDKPVNVPGTSTEYPNWRRKLSKDLESFLNDPGLVALANRLTNARKQ
ncbi:4-alpha-glucanotransferase [uncultured Tolumonas sp.]|uniref:4-alpha-glucanotransferase n=1 Tax=uncultured Tolumonas sp. TaxID=263765 RepID=UPI002A0A5E4D|nr:4-alpha-glucanotransferase [uncultured Tolumonas sp.]